MFSILAIYTLRTFAYPPLSLSPRISITFALGCSHTISERSYYVSVERGAGSGELEKGEQELMSKLQKY
jgi:hypothetical protein